MTRLEQHVRTAEQLATSLRDLLPGLSEDVVEQVKREFQEKLGNYGPDTAIGLVPNLTASRISNRPTLMGPPTPLMVPARAHFSHWTKVFSSCEADGVMCTAGGVHLSHDVAFWSVFCQLGALSRKQDIRPFDRDADGLLIGEGLGMVVLKRLSDARRDNDRIYAVIRGVGVSEDGREASIMTPRVEGQMKALASAWRDSGLNPDEIGYLEAHGTATPAGDTAELTTLSRFFGEGSGPAPHLGSVKALIGHTMPAAGMRASSKPACPSIMVLNHPRWDAPSQTPRSMRPVSSSIRPRSPGPLKSVSLGSTPSVLVELTPTSLSAMLASLLP